MLIRGKILWLRLYRQLLQPKRFAIFQACLIGLVSALAAVLLKQGVGYLGGWRVHMTHVLPAWLVLPAIGLGGGLLSGWLVERMAPEASGSGISQVKAVLAKVPVSLNLRVAIVKLFSAMIALASGLPLGREGPTLQVGAAIANQVNRLFPSSPDYRRQIIAAGAGAGLAAAFDAPISGFLFVVEELLQDVSGFTLGTAILASFIGAVISRWLGGHSLVLELTALQTNFSLPEIPFYLALGVLAGLLGGLFNRGIIASIKFNNRWLPFGLPLRVGLAGLICGIVVALLPAPFRDTAGLRETLTAGDLSAGVTIIAFVSQFVLILIAYGSGAPGGLLVPPMLLGAALGYLVGIAEHSMLGITSPTTYALAGMGTFLSAVARVPITSIIIVFEMTTDFNLVLPLMIGAVVAYLVAEKVAAGSLYDHLLELSGIHIEQEPKKEGLLSRLNAVDVMQHRVETLSSQMSVDEALQAFSNSQHRNFPVIDGRKVVGMLTQKDVANIASLPSGGNTPISEVMTPEPVTVSPQDTLAYVLHLLNRHNLNCLPVTEVSKLVGIITRSDIIRVEAEQLSGKTSKVASKAKPSYVVYQTRSPETGKGRLLVPLSHPGTAQTLLEMALAIAKERNYELECLQVILVPRGCNPAQTPVQTTDSHHLLNQALQLGQEKQIPVHTQIRVADNIARAILETVRERHIDLVLMGWKGKTSTPGRVFSRVVDTVIRQATCDLVLVKLNGTIAFNRWLLSVAGGPNSRQALQLLPALASLSSTPEIKVCQVFQPNGSTPDTKPLETSVRFLKRKVGAHVMATPVRADSVCEAVIECAEKDQSDVIVLGASREKLLQKAIKGNIPETISRKSHCTVILVRSALG
ncbi:chloride channel protein [Brasilonema octagenarum UFV-E1]|uniref:Chloride channel protein n=1 Tax=Brasilonema sennae CENA114 TaxID=415709 RepID=A0A856MGF4_9CYAN|nr:chloride channel protein [Brasilonema sennae]QDL08761.1 chloride channel protein [Brasilonema sennae CENA114]QDL15119.1 chloride channel protein [Brasilonema octagenarum UFV-E1]